MASFNRHRKNAEVDPKFKDTPWKDRGYVAWLTWGGTSGVNWAIRKSNSFKKTKASDTEQECVSRKIPIIKDENPDMEIDQVIAIAYSYCQKAHKHKGMRIPFEELFYSIIGTEDEKNYRPADFVEKAENDEEEIPEGYHKMPDGTIMPDSAHKTEEDEGDFKFGYYRFTDDLGDWNWQDDYELVDYQNVGLDEITVNEDFMIRDSDIEKGSERVRPLTIIHYLNDKKEMKPLIVDMNYNLLDGHHRYYCCEKKDQIMVRVARVKPKTKLKKKEKKIKQKSPIKAPKGGVTVNGQFYRGGMFLPKEATENLTEEQKEAVARGEDVDTTEAETTQERTFTEAEQKEINEMTDNIEKNRSFSKGSYEATINSKEFKDWFGNSSVVDTDGNAEITSSVDYDTNTKGKPLVVFHGTTHEFNEFTMQNANVENDIGRGFYFTNSNQDVSSNYLDDGADLTNRISQMAERLEGEGQFDNYEDAEKEAKKRLVGDIKEGKVMQTFLKIEKPATLDLQNKYKDSFSLVEDLGEYPDEDDFDDEDDYYDAVDEYNDKLYSGIDQTLGSAVFNSIDNLRRDGFDVDFDQTEFLQNFSEKLELADNNGETSPTLIYNAIKEMTGEMEMYAYTEDDSYNYVGGEMTNLILREFGFDGIVYENPKDHFPNMQMSEGTKHYVVFDSSNVKSISSENFDADEKDIYKSTE